MRRDSNNAFEIAKQEMLKSKMAVYSLYGQTQSIHQHDSVRRTHSLSKAEKLSIKQMNKQFLEQNPSQITGIDDRYLLDEQNYQPSTEFNVTLNF